MTHSTNNNDIKKMLRSIAGMMVMFGLFATRAFKTIGTRQFTSGNSMINGVACFPASWKTSLIIFYSMIDSCFAYFALLISLFGRFALFTLVMFSDIFSATYFTMILITTFPFGCFVKLRKQFYFLTFATFFGYGLFSHNQLLYSWLRLEPVARYALAVGSFNSNYYSQKRKGKI